MTKFLIKVALFILLNIALYAVVVAIPLMRHDFTNDTTESNLIAMPGGKNFDVLFMGTSHARIFTRNGNRARVEQILSKTTYNISNGGGHGGIFPESLLLERFYGEGNSVKTLVYLVDPWVFYSRQWNEANYFLDDEPVDVEFYLSSIRNGTERATIISGLQSKLSRRWLTLAPATTSPNTQQIKLVTKESILKDNEDAYLDGLNQENFSHYSKIFEKTILLAQQNGSNIVLVFTPTLLGDEPGKKQIWGFLQELQGRYRGIEIFDFSNSIQDPRLFYDNNHLNSEGVSFYAKKYLLPVLSKNKEKL